MAQKNRANMLTDIVSNIYNNLINFITGQNAQDRFVNLLDSSPNILSDKDQADGYVGLGPTLEIFSSYYDEEISRTDLISDLTANLAVGGKFYRINDAVGATITLLVIAESNLNLYQFAIDATTGEVGTYDITTDVFTTVSGIPTLQQVTTAGATTTNSITVDNGTDSVVIQPNQIKIANATGYGTIAAANLTADPNFELPNKATGTYTFAMLSDITGGVASVNSGTNISVDNTDPANPIINSLSDRYSTTSVTSNTISNGAKTFTVDADLAYIPLQEVLIVNDATHHMHATVTSYSGTTLVVDVTSHTGSGTFIVWVLNLDGVPVDAITGVGTANEIAYFTGGQVIASLPVATYPSLTELSYVKGATSAIQTQINGKLNLTGGSLSGALNEAKGADIASAATTDIGAATGNYVVVTGTTTITALGTVQAGTRRIVKFSGILILTHNATSLILPTAANITTAAGDTATFVSLGSGNWVCTNYMRASGAALVGGGSGGGRYMSVGAGTAVTGTINNTYSKGLLIPANTFVAGDVWQLDFSGTKSATNGTIIFRAYANTVNSIAGSPILLATSPTSANTARTAASVRTIGIEVANGTGNGSFVLQTTSATYSPWGANTAAFTTLAIDWTVDQYIVVSIQLGSGSDSASCNLIYLH